MELLNCPHETEGFCQFDGYCQYKDETLVGYDICTQYCKEFIRSYYRTDVDLDNLTESDRILINKAKE